jgi:hypothetical protein
MLAFLSLLIHGDPAGMSLVHVLVRGMRAGAGYDVHAEFPAFGHQVAEAVPAAKESAR